MSLQWMRIENFALHRAGRARVRCAMQPDQRAERLGQDQLLEAIFLWATVARSGRLEARVTDSDAVRRVLRVVGTRR